MNCAAKISSCTFSLRSSIPWCKRIPCCRAPRNPTMSSFVATPYLPTPGPSDPGTSTVYPYGLKSLSEGTTVYDAVKRIGTEFEEVPLQQSQYVRPSSLIYQFDGKPRRWDVVESHPSVGVVLYHKGLHAFLIVRQFRPAVYAAEMRNCRVASLPPPSLVQGFTYELCAGLIDKAKSITQICREEIAEEVGYDVPLERISQVTSAIASAGTSGARHVIFFAEVDDSMRSSGGGGLVDHGECIEVLALPFDQVLPFVLDDSLPKSPGLMFGLLWAQQALNAGQIGSLASSGSNGLLTSALTLNPVLPA